MNLPLEAREGSGYMSWILNSLKRLSGGEIEWKLEMEV